jgi:hypothetical protein
MGGGGGGLSTEDASKVQEAAEARLRAIASKSTKVLFVCEESDRKSLDSFLERSTVFPRNRTAIIDGSQASLVDAALDSVTFLVVFSDQAQSTPFVDTAIDMALRKKISGVHVKAQPKALVPSKISAYRWRSLTWEELEAIFSA